MLVRTLANRLLEPISINTNSNQLRTLSAEETRQILAQDPVFVSIIQSYMKRLYSSYAKELQAYFTFPTATISAIQNSDTYGHKIVPKPAGANYIEDLSSSEPSDVINAAAVIIMTAVAALPSAHADDILQAEILYSYDEAARLKDTTKQIFGITIDTDFSDFTTLDSGTIIGTGDGSEKFQGWPSWAGVDAVVTIIMGSYVRFIPDFGTISYSVHREKMDVKPLGFAGRRGHTSGPRTIAGSLIGVALKNEPLRDIQPTIINDLSSLDQVGEDASPYRETMLPDQLPDFDLLVTVQNEYGHSARITLFGVTITDVGQTTSIQDLQQEIVYQYTASDIDLLSYVGRGESAQSISLSLDAFKERRDRIDSGRTLHSSPFDVPEFWDVWSPEKRLIMEPGELKLSNDFGEYGKSAINKIQQEIDDKKKLEENRKKLQAQSILPRQEAVPDCQIEITRVYAASDSMHGEPAVPEVAAELVTVAHGISESDVYEWNENKRYISPTNLVTKDGAKTKQGGSFSSLRNKTLVSSNFTYGYAWQTTADNKPIIFMELAARTMLSSIEIQYMTGVASYKQIVGTTTALHTAIDLLTNHKVIETLSLKFRVNGKWTSWITYPQDLSSALVSPDSANIASRIKLIGLAKYATSGTEEMQYTDAIMMRIDALAKNPSNTSAFEFDHTAIAAIIPVGKKKENVDKQAQPGSQVINIGTHPKNAGGFSRKKIGNSFQQVKLKLVTFEGDGKDNANNTIPENVVDKFDTSHTATNYNAGNGYPWIIANSNVSTWTPDQGASVVLIPDTTNGESAWFYLHDLAIIKGCLVNNPPAIDPRYYRTPSKVKVTLYRGSNDPTKTDAENELIDQNFNANLLTMAVSRDRSNYGDRDTIYQRLTDWASDKTNKGILFEGIITLDDKKGRQEFSSGVNYEESLLVSYTEKDADKAKANYRGIPVVCIKLEFQQYYAPAIPNAGNPNMYAWFAITEILATQYNENNTVPVKRTSTTSTFVNIGTWNVLDMDKPNAYELIAKEIAKKDLDIIVLQEFQKDNTSRKSDIAPLLNQFSQLQFAKGNNYLYQSTTNGGSGEDYVTIFYNSTIFEFTTSVDLATDIYDRAQLFARFKIKDTSMYLNLVGCHLKSNFVGTGPSPTTTRAAQATAIRNYLTTNSYIENSYTIILGDMNAKDEDFAAGGSLAILEGSSTDMIIITPKSGSSYVSTYFDSKNRYPAGSFDHMIITYAMTVVGPEAKEYIYYDSEKPCRANSRDDSLSDHVLVWAPFEIRKDK